MKSRSTRKQFQEVLLAEETEIYGHLVHSVQTHTQVIQLLQRSILQTHRQLQQWKKARHLSQIASDKTKIEHPKNFWKLSIAGSVLIKMGRFLKATLCFKQKLCLVSCKTSGQRWFAWMTTMFPFDLKDHESIWKLYFGETVPQERKQKTENCSEFRNSNFIICSHKVVLTATDETVD